MNCPNCNQEVPEGKSFCPECGSPVNGTSVPEAKKQKKSITKKGWFWVVIVLLAIGIIGVLSGGHGDDDADTPVVNNGTPVRQEVTGKSEITMDRVKEIVLYDANDIKITYVESSSDWLGNTFKFLVENNSNRNITVSVENLSVNGFSVSSWFYAQVAAGKKTNENLEIYRSGLDDNNIDKIEDMEFTFHIIDSDSYRKIDDTDRIYIHHLFIKRGDCAAQADGE